MAINAAEVFRRVRVEITADLDASNYRWPDAVLVGFGNETARELMTLNPHLLIDDNGNPSRADEKLSGVTAESLEQNTASWPFPSVYMEAMIHGVAMRCFMQDAGDQFNASRANYERARFNECAGVRMVSAQQ